MKMLTTWMSLTFILLAGAGHAHHSVPVNFDTSKNITVAGIITEVKWINPHSHIALAVTNEEGVVENWLVEMNAVNTIRRLAAQLNLDMNEFVVGDPLTVSGWPGRNANAVYFRRATLASGKEVIWESRLDPDLTRLEDFGEP
jgi:hypothetical protein